MLNAGRIKVQANNFSLVIDSGGLGPSSFREIDRGEFPLSPTEPDVLGSLGADAPADNRVRAIDTVERESIGGATTVVDGGELGPGEEHTVLNAGGIYVVSCDDAINVDRVAVSLRGRLVRMHIGKGKG